MVRITRSKAKAEADQVTEDNDHAVAKNDEREKSPSEFEPELDVAPSATSIKRRTKKGKPKNANLQESKVVPHRQTITLAPGVTKSIARQNYALPLPSSSHRHRGIPVYLPAGLQIPRLLDKPSPFSNHETVSTNSVANPDVFRRVTRALNSNIGEGPIWELLEDRSWYKECLDGQKRPLVHTNIALGTSWKLLSQNEAAPHLPTDSSTMHCYIGPFNDQKKRAFAPMQSTSLSDLFPEKKSHVFYAGGPVWGIDWCPILSEGSPRRKHYLAVGPLPSKRFSARVGKPALRPSLACIQIWSLSPSAADNSLEDPGSVACEMILCIDTGPALDLKWCPLPTHDEPSSERSQKKLGILAGVFEDGSVSLFVVPDPDSLRSKQQESETLYVKLDPRVRIEIPHTTCVGFDWANSDLIAVGCSNGYLAIYNVKKTLDDSSHGKLHQNDEAALRFLLVLRPSHYISVHQSAIRSVAWVKAPRTLLGSSQSSADPTIVLSGGYDGALMATDLRDLRGNIIYRTRDVINSIGFSHHLGGFLASDNENTVKNFGITPPLLGRGHSFVEPDGPVWSIGTSDFHPQLAVGSADGTCRTTNVMKSTRKGGSVPFLVHKIYQLDYNRTTGEFRLLDNLLPYEYLDRSVTTRPTAKQDALDRVSISTGVWSPEVGVTKVVWNCGSGIGQSPWLASATASGLCRLDWLLGRFAYDRFPYGDIQRLRGETEMDEVDELDELEDEEIDED